MSVTQTPTINFVPNQDFFRRILQTLCSFTQNVFQERKNKNVIILPLVNDTGIRTVLPTARTVQLHPGKQSRKTSVNQGIREQYLVQWDLRKETTQKAKFEETAQAKTEGFILFYDNRKAPERERVQI